MRTPDHNDLIASAAPSAEVSANASAPPAAIRRKPPGGLKLSVRRHARGHFFVREKGKDIYLSTNLNEAHRKAVDLLGADRIQSIDGDRPRGVVSFASKVQRDFKRWKKTPTAEKQGKTFREGASDFFETIEAGKGALTAKHYRKTLGSFLAVFGDQALNELPPTELRRYRIELIKKYAPKSVNHHLASLRRFFRFCFDMDYVKQPMRANLLKSVPLIR